MNWEDCWVQKDTHTTTGTGLFARQQIRRGQPIFRTCPEAAVNLYVLQLVNHSCIPNMFALQGLDAGTGLLDCRFYALRDIAAGEELTRCYDDRMLLEESVAARRAWLADMWDFECLCPKCVGQWVYPFWDCPQDWKIDYALPDEVLSEYMNGLVRAFRDEYMKPCVMEKTRIMSQRTLFSLQCFRDQVKFTARKLKKRTLSTRYKFKIGGKTLHDYAWSQNYKKLLKN
ncbi:uncharacterized protein H6S33_000389 [Morchella sextelata]|jgi:hypothetical protein|uniref:uncharacterized protein n=1 Tax=Morchella sextelata TaxID=1174677 RepID=UPI001D03ED6C|nr:uncharacterized protein H6S33_000389 [Morchella sextelata]KAH0614753.1 hypothetical protein H6S33_000389 [Morchella sextelata]